MDTGGLTDAASTSLCSTWCRSARPRAPGATVAPADAMPLEPRTGQAPPPVTRDELHDRFALRFYDPAFDKERDAIARLEEIAWQAFSGKRKAPVTRKAGDGFADPAYEVPVEWLATRERLSRPPA